jgi:hypothetical protein
MLIHKLKLNDQFTCISMMGYSVIKESVHILYTDNRSNKQDWEECIPCYISLHNILKCGFAV